MNGGVNGLLAALDAAGCRPRQTGRERWAALCPVHEADDQRHSPSLSVGTGRDGRALVFCFAGCEPEAVLGQLGLEWADIMPEGGLRFRRARVPVPQRAGPRPGKAGPGRPSNRQRWGFPRPASRRELVAAADRLGGVTPGSLAALRVASFGDGLIFPMVNAGGEVVGWRFRAWSGRKWARRGGRNGLFVPRGLRPDAGLCVCEGPTDTAAVLGLGFRGFGLAAATSGLGDAVALLRRMRPPIVILLRDADAAGQRWAEKLGRRLSPEFRVRVWWPPAGAKDIRELTRRDKALAQREIAEAMQI